MNNELANYDMLMYLRKYTENYDITLLHFLEKDLELYLSIEKQELETSFSEETINARIKEYHKKRKEAPYRITPNLKSIKDKTAPKTKKSLDMEELMYPHKFFQLYLFRSLIKQTIKDNEQNNSIAPVNWTGNQTELMELIKALIENGSVKGKQKDIIINFCHFFNIEIKNPDKLINDIRRTRNNGNETIFIDKLKNSLLNFINKENRR